MFGRRRILIVDGGSHTTEAYPTWLMDAGHDTSVVDDAPRALILAPLLRPELIVIDLEHLGASGGELIGQLLDLDALSALRIVALGASFTVTQRDRVLLLPKPVIKVDLLEAVRSAKW